MVSSENQEIIPEAQDVLESDLFPLPLNPFEKYVLWDRSEDMQMVSFFEVHFESRVHLPSLAQGMATAVHRNPFFACTIAEGEEGLCWQYDPRFQPKILMERDEDVLENGKPRLLDLTQDVGFRSWYREEELEGQVRSRLLLQVHHAVSDGIGIRRFLVETWTKYASLRQQADEVPSSEQDSDRKRDRFRLKKVELKSLVERFDLGPPAQGISTWQRIKNARYFHFAPPKPLESRGLKDSSADLKQIANEPLRHATLSRSSSSAVLDKIRSDELSMNDVGIGLLFQACKNWNEAGGKHRPNTRLRVLMPYDFRSRVDLRMPACNRMSFAFLGRTHQQCENTDELIRSVADEVEEIKQTRLPMDFIEALKLATSYPGAFRWILGRSNAMSTAVLTYAGDVVRGLGKSFPEEDGVRIVGDLRLANILAAPPVRRNTNISLALCINWGQICISAAWNRNVLSAAECQLFVDEYRQLWEQWAGVEKSEE